MRSRPGTAWKQGGSRVTTRSKRLFSRPGNHEPPCFPPTRPVNAYARRVWQDARQCLGEDVREDRPAAVGAAHGVVDHPAGGGADCPWYGPVGAGQAGAASNSLHTLFHAETKQRGAEPPREHQKPGLAPGPLVTFRPVQRTVRDYLCLEGKNEVIRIGRGRP